MDHRTLLARIQKVQSKLVAIWPSGREAVCVAEDGHHYTLPGRDRPASIGAVESRLLYNIVRLSAARRAVEIGTGFGYSSLWIAGALQANAAETTLWSIDDLSEGGLGHAGHEFAREAVAVCGLAHVVELVVGKSPDILGDLDIPIIDFAFIDGHHKGDQPVLDYLGLAPLLSNDAIVVWHDVQANYTVSDGIARAARDGWSTIVFPTSCRMAMSYRTIQAWRIGMRAFALAEKLKLAAAT